MLNPEIQDYNEKLSVQDKEICDQLMDLINSNLLDSESKVRHGHPVWFLNGNPVVGYSKQKSGVCLLFRSGQSFDEEGLKPEGKFKAAEICYASVDQINDLDLRRWLQKAKSIQWDYKNIVKHKGALERL